MPRGPCTAEGGREGGRKGRREGGKKGGKSREERREVSKVLRCDDVLAHMDVHRENKVGRHACASLENKTLFSLCV
jgi:hypothetical protein